MACKDRSVKDHEGFFLNGQKNVDISLLGALNRVRVGARMPPPFLKLAKYEIHPTFLMPIDVAYPGARLRPLSSGNMAFLLGLRYEF